MNREVTIKEVLYQFNTKSLDGRDVNASIPEYDEVYGLIKTALEIDKEGYNVYVIDDFTKDKVEYLTSFIKQNFQGREKPKDICYVIQLDEKIPQVLFVENGFGKKLKEIIEEIKDQYYEGTFEFYSNSSNYKNKEELIEQIQKKKNQLVERLVKVAKKDGFDIKTTKGGFTFVPLKEENLMLETEYDNLSLERKEEIMDKVNQLKESAQDILEELKISEMDEIQKIKILMKEYFRDLMKEIRRSYGEEFKGQEEVINYLNIICNSIEGNIIENYSTNYEEDEDKINECIFKYMINVIVDNSENEIPPVVFEEDPNINNLLGSIEYENHNGTYITDVTFIKAGALIKANGGCLILRMKDLVENPAAYYYLKKCLSSEKVNFDYNKGYLEFLSLGGIKPQDIKIKEKVILIGEYETYELLYNFDEDFKNIFKIRAQFTPILEINNKMKKVLLQRIHSIIEKNSLKGINEEGIKEIAKSLSRKADCKNKFYFDENEISRLLFLANNKVLHEGSEVIQGADIRDILYKEELVEKEILEEYKEGRLFIKVKDRCIGQINGLSVLDAGYARFGKPIRITCSCYKGEGNIIDVQKESNLSGNIHNKSIHIIKGYMNKLMGGYTKLPIDFYLSFEQLYGKVDGDSASVAEVICMLSALSKLPIKQNIAVTGSVNQLGEVQPIGGINEKIEGFYKICKMVDTIEGKGVLLPHINCADLILNSEVEESIKKGDFHLYTMETIEDAMDVLMGTDTIKNEDIFSCIRREIKKYMGKR